MAHSREGCAVFAQKLGRKTELGALQANIFGVNRPLVTVEFRAIEIIAQKFDARHRRLNRSRRPGATAATTGEGKQTNT